MPHRSRPLRDSTRPGGLLTAAMLGAVLLVACGGSASETPPPLEPDARGPGYLGESMRPRHGEESNGARKRARPSTPRATERDPATTPHAKDAPGTIE